MPTLLAFHGENAIREKYVNRVRAHQEADEIVAGTYWEDGKGCAVGCSIHGSSHAAYETEIGIPRTLARLEDRLFEVIYTFDRPLAKAWPLRFMSAPKVGADLELVWPRFAHWLLVAATHGVIKHATCDAIADAAIADAAAAAIADADARRVFYSQYGYWSSWRWYRGYRMINEKGRAHYVLMADKLIELMEAEKPSPRRKGRA